MQLEDFNFILPPELIAKYPEVERSNSRLLWLNPTTGCIQHRKMQELPQLLLPGDLLVFNDTRVIPARLFGSKLSGGKVEILIERIFDEKNALAHLRTSKSLKIGQVFLLSNGIEVEVIGRKESLFELRFLAQNTVREILEQIGQIPLPSYMERDAEQLDQERYQTIYSKVEGAVAAPTAGLHFDQKLLNNLAQQGIESTFITLHVGAGTFQPVRTANITEHAMHKEVSIVSESVCEQIRKTKLDGGRIVAVGTTSVRALETASAKGRLEPYSGETNLFIYPGYQFNCVDAILTNFHLPKSSLLMLVSAFAGYDNLMNSYEAAIQNRYRFFSYGDAMLVAN